MSRIFGMANIRTRATADGPRYDVRYKINGKHRTKTWTKLADARSYRKKVEGEEMAGLIVDPKGGERLFGPYADNWIETRLVKGKPLTPATRQGYKALMRRHLRPAFGETKLRQITKERVNNWYARIATDKSQDQAAKAYRLLRAILITAVSEDLIAQNPCGIKGAGIEDHAERPKLETSTVLELADAIVPRLRCLILLGGFVGLRPGELLGLQRRDIDLLHGTVTVVRGQHEITGLGTITTDPKSEAGKRTLPMPKYVEEPLKAHLDEDVASEPDAPIFTRPSGLALRRADLSEAWRDACAKVGLTGARVHDLRHHALTEVARNPNTTTKEVMVFGGHSSPRAALGYQHATSERLQQIASHLDDVIATAKSAPKSAPVRLRS
jgi:integrase